MRENEFLDSVSNIEIDVVERFASMDNKLQKKVNKPKGAYLRIVAVAACIALTVGAIIALPLLRKDDPNKLQIDDPPIVFDAIVAPENSNGNNSEFIVGSSTRPSSSGVSSSPPLFQFDTYNIIVKARVVKNFPDQYNLIFSSSSSSRPLPYRLIQMQTIEVIHGENVPQYFMYLIADFYFVDMSVYDTLIISMEQRGAENYVLKNATKNQIEAFELPIFSDERGRPDNGNIIPFKDGVFDVSLWRHWGHSFDKKSYHNIVKSLKDSESDVIAEIQRKTETIRTKASVVTLNSFKTQSAKDAIAYVAPFKNGVFSQTYASNANEPYLTFCRYVNGCPTDEIVTINIFTEEVQYSNDRYTAEDIVKMEDMSVHLSKKAKEYKNQTPMPPHIADLDEKKLLGLNLYAWYEMVDGKMYGVLKTSWLYQEKYSYMIQFYDEAYILYDMTESSASEVSREDLIAILGNDNENIYNGELGAEIEVRMP